MPTSEAPVPSSKWGNRGTVSDFHPQVIDAISRAVVQTPGCVLLDVDAGPSTNRTVYTFVGQPKDVVEGALNAARAAFRLIDMSQHKGEGPEHQAVCPHPQGLAQGIGAEWPVSLPLGEPRDTESVVPGKGPWHLHPCFGGSLCMSGSETVAFCSGLGALGGREAKTRKPACQQPAKANTFTVAGRVKGWWTQGAGQKGRVSGHSQWGEVRPHLKGIHK